MTAGMQREPSAERAEWGDDPYGRRSVARPDRRDRRVEGSGLRSRADDRQRRWNQMVHALCDPVRRGQLRWAVDACRPHGVSAVLDQLQPRPLERAALVWCDVRPAVASSGRLALRTRHTGRVQVLSGRLEGTPQAPSDRRTAPIAAEVHRVGVPGTEPGVLSLERQRERPRTSDPFLPI